MVEAGLSSDAFAEANLFSQFNFRLIKWMRRPDTTWYHPLIIAYRLQLVAIETCKKPIHILLGNLQYLVTDRRKAFACLGITVSWRACAHKWCCCLVATKGIGKIAHSTHIVLGNLQYLVTDRRKAFARLGITVSWRACAHKWCYLVATKDIGKIAHSTSLLVYCFEDSKRARGTRFIIVLIF